MKGGAEVRGEKATTGAGEGVIKKGNKRELGKMYCLPRTHTYIYMVIMDAAHMSLLCEGKQWLSLLLLTPIRLAASSKHDIYNTFFLSGFFWSFCCAPIMRV